jgi:arsenate reductase
MFPVVMFHNPDCGASRNTLAMIEASGLKAIVYNYLVTGWTRPLLDSLFAAMAIAPREALREKGTPAAELGLLAAATGDDDILSAMLTHPILVNRPIVVTPLGARLCRPSETVFDILPAGPARFVKEDGEVVCPRKG